MSGTALTIGNFDGVHMGHIALVRRARELVGASGRVVALAFDPHPVSVLRPESAPARLTTFVRRRELLMAAACDEVVQLAPTAHLLGKSPEDFLRSVVDRYRPLYLVEGDDFRFGKARAGDVKTLAALGPSMGFEAVLVPPVEVVLSDHLVVRASSSIVRWLLLHGRVADAARVLGRPYELAGTVVRGDQVGRQLGFPTANLKTDCLPPSDGIYAATAEAPGGCFAAAVNIGTRPTFNGKERRAEAHLMPLDRAVRGPLPLPEYDWPLTLRFAAWVRDDARFESVESLVEQIERDCARVHRVLSFANNHANHEMPEGTS
jgi:riboflavin kinase/FMN adenylyltransferase